MKAKLLFFLFLTGLAHTQGLGQFLANYYQDREVSFKSINTGNFIHSEAGFPNGELYHLPSNVDNHYFNQNFKIENGVTNNYYRLRHIPTGKYVTVLSYVNSLGICQLRNLNDCPNTDYQEFKFIQQTPSYIYKIHVHFSNNGLEGVLVAHQGTENRIVIEPNETTGNSDQQKWYITNLTPDVNPSDGIPNLGNQFEGHTVGLTEQQYNNNVKGYPDYPIIYASGTYAGFEQEFKIEYTDEVGWYRIRHKASNKFVTINGAYPRSRIELQSADQFDYQKFKFIYQSPDKYEIHSKFTQGPEVGNGAALLLSMAQTDANFHMTLAADNTNGGPSSSWQLFQLTKYVNPAQPAAFSSGVPTDGSGKILGKQYYITARETLALLEPYIVGSDTFVHIQQNPVYGEKSEWTLDAGRKANGRVSFRIRYGPTNQYLYFSSASTTTLTANTPMRLKTAPFADDDHYEFEFDQLSVAEHWFRIQTRLGNVGTANRLLAIDDEGFLINDAGTAATADNSRHFAINLSLPTSNPATVTYVITGRTNGRFMSDSGKVGIVDAVHIQHPNRSCFYNFIPTGFGHYYIQNQLTKNFIRQGTGQDVLNSESNSLDRSQWDVVSDINYFRIKNAITGKYLRIRDTSINNLMRVGLITDIGVDLIISRADYVTEPEIATIPSADILDNYAPAAMNVLNSSFYADEFIRNLGLPFEPSSQISLHPSFGLQNLQDQGFNTSAPLPSFLPVIKAALKYRYGYSDGKADSALRNYKLDDPAQRIQVCHAIKLYLLDNLAQQPRSSWNFNETELVAWIERKVNLFKAGYAGRLRKSWDDFYTAQSLGNNDPLEFSTLLDNGIPAYEDFTEPNYFLPSIAETQSLAEYAAFNKSKNYLNPGRLKTLTVPALTVAGGGILGALTAQFAIIPALTAHGNAIIAAAIAAEEGVAEVTAVGGPSLGATVGAETFLSAIAGADAATVEIAVVTMAVQIIIMQAMDLAQYKNFKNQIEAKATRFENANTNINTTMQGTNILDQYDLSQDFDYILGSGTRFDSYANNFYSFTGNGNWNAASNWSNGQVPPNPLPANTVVVIDGSGDCILNVPVTLPSTSKIVVNPNKLFTIKNTLTIPNLKIIQ